MRYRSFHKDLLVISYLRRDARESLTRISRLTHIPISTIFDKLRFTRGRLIKKFTTIVDFQGLGFYIKALLLLKVKKEERDSIKDFLIRHKHVNSAYKVNNNYDFSVEVIFKNIGDLEKFNEELESSFHIEEKQTLFIVEDIKTEEFLSSPEFLHMIDFNF